MCKLGKKDYKEFTVKDLPMVLLNKKDKKVQPKSSDFTT